MIATKVVIQSLEDAKMGKSLVDGVTSENIEKAEELTVAILEGGMESGKTSIMFILRDGNKAKVGEMSAAQMEMLIGAFKGAIQRFEGR